MKLLPIFLLLCITTHSQGYNIYQIRTRCCNPSTFIDTLSIRNDSLFLKSGSNYTFQRVNKVKQYADYSYLNNMPSFVQRSDTSSGVMASAYRLAFTRDSLANALAASTAATYATIATVSGKLATNGSAAALTNFPVLNQNTTGSAATLSAPLSFANGGQTGTAAAGATTGTIALTVNSSIISITPTGAVTFTSASAVTGQRISIIVTTSGTSSFVITFGSGFKSTSTLATGTTTGKTFVVSFIGSSNTYIETSRTAAQ